MLGIQSEYMNLVRSNEELLDHSERVHKKTITRLVSHGVKQDARDEDFLNM